MRLIEQIITIKHCCQNREEELRESLNLSVSEYNCLSSFPFNETVTGNALAGRLHLSPSRMSRIAEVLVQKGLLSRTQDASDRRIQHYSITAGGLDKKEKIQGLLNECEAQLKSRLSEKQLKDVECGLSALLAAMSD